MTYHYIMGALLLCIAHVASAAIYTYIDAQGERVYTDKPPQHQRVERVNIAPTNQLPAVPAHAPIKPPPVYLNDTSNPVAHYQVLRILAPEPNATIRANDRQLIVMITSEPALMEGHLYRVLLDGEPAVEPSRSPVFALSEINRGTHKLAVEIINQQGAILERTPAQPLHLRQTTLNDKRRVHPCQDEDYGVRPECPLQDKPEKKSSLLPF